MSENPVKTCSKCKEIKNSDEFYPDKRLKSGLASACKQCYAKKRENLRRIGYQSDYLLQYRYGITQEDYNRIYNEQNGLCKLCSKSQSEYFCRTKKLVVDHCHNNGQVRGLICSPCNTLLGKIEKYYKNDLTLLIKYLFPHNAK